MMSTVIFCETKILFFSSVVEFNNIRSQSKDDGVLHQQCTNSFFPLLNTITEEIIRITNSNAKNIIGPKMLGYHFCIFIWWLMVGHGFNQKLMRDHVLFLRSIISKHIKNYHTHWISRWSAINQTCICSSISRFSCDKFHRYLIIE